MDFYLSKKVRSNNNYAFVKKNISSYHMYYDTKHTHCANNLFDHWKIIFYDDDIDTQRNDNMPWFHHWNLNINKQ